MPPASTIYGGTSARLEAGFATCPPSAPGIKIVLRDIHCCQRVRGSTSVRVLCVFTYDTCRHRPDAAREAAFYSVQPRYHSITIHNLTRGRLVIFIVPFRFLYLPVVPPFLDVFSYLAYVEFTTVARTFTLYVHYFPFVKFRVASALLLITLGRSNLWPRLNFSGIT